MGQGMVLVMPSHPVFPWCMPGLSAPEKPIVLAHKETCCPYAGPGSGVAANAPAAGSTTVPATRATPRRMRTVFMINAFRGW